MNNCSPLIPIKVAGHDRKTLLINKEIAQGHESQTGLEGVKALMMSTDPGIHFLTMATLGCVPSRCSGFKPHHSITTGGCLISVD